MSRVVVYGLVALVVVAIGAGIWLYAPDRGRAGLVAQYAGAPSQFLEVAGTTLHMRDTGPRGAPAVVLLHGFGSSLQTWDAWAADLERDHRVIRYDLPGSGLSGADATGDYTDARSVAVLLGLLDRLEVAKADVVGNSMGGRFAWEFAAAQPERMDKLVLVSPDGFASPGVAYEAAPSVPLLLRTLPYVLPGFMLRGSLAAAYADPAVLTAQLYTRYRDLMLAPGVRRAIVARTSQHVLHDPVARLRSIRVPVLLLWGEQDRMIPFSNSADYLAALPNATLAPLPGVGHVPQEEVPARSVAIVRAFLDGKDQ